MKKSLLLIILALMLASCGLTDSIIVKQVNPDSMIHYSNIYSFDGELADEDYYVLYFTAGDRIPLRIVLNNDYVRVDENSDINMIAKRNIYFMIKNPENSSNRSNYKISRNSRIFISFDAVRWSSIHNSETLKEIAGFDEESVSFGFEATNQDGIRSQLTIENR
ncbi:MAG: hypothetical protein JXK07_13130 [Spirochaetes bacterium]|nr:hypothetical protein [Spirochaetota bacterium]MBN2769798.1 hypothetical protein [Spirochaetota bacterium]